MALIVLFVALISLLFPSSALWIELSWINYLLMVIMFGMGLTISPKDFALVFTNPKDIFCGVVSQYLFMPLIAYFLRNYLSLEFPHKT